MQAHGYLPYALARFGLMPGGDAPPPFPGDQNVVSGKVPV
jgi:hypothetical protein